MAYSVVPTTGTSQVSNSIIDRYIPAQTLKVAEHHMRVVGLGKKLKVPGGESATVSWTRFPHLSLPLVPLTEGTPPDATALSTERVTVILEQWGAVVTVSDLGELESRNSPINIAIERLGRQAARTMDRECVAVLLGASTVVFPNGKTSRASLTDSDVPNAALMRKIHATLENTGAPTYEGDSYIGLCDPYLAQDILADALVVQLGSYQDATIIRKGEIGMLFNIRWIRTNTTPTMSLSANSHTDGTDTAATGEAALASATYYTVCMERDANGFLTAQTAETTEATPTILTVTTPNVSGKRYDVYTGTTSGGPYVLQFERVAHNTTVRICGTGLGTSSSKTYQTTGRTAQAVPASGVTVRTGWVMGDGFFSVPELQALKTYRVSGASKSDPLDQSTILGWKVMFKAAITDHSFGVKFECCSAYD